jgi:dTMP kinase
MTVNASHLLFSFNRWEKREQLLSLLERGVNVIVDRYAYSGVVYSVCNVLLILLRVLILNGV